MPGDQKPDEQHADEDGDHESASQRRADPRQVDRGAGALPDDRAAHALVPRSDAVDLQQHPGEQEPDGDRQRKQDRVAAEDCSQEDTNGIAGADRTRESLSQPAGGGLEDRRPRAVAAILDRLRGGLGDRHGRH